MTVYKNYVFTLSKDPSKPFLTMGIVARNEDEAKFIGKELSKAHQFDYISVRKGVGKLTEEQALPTMKKQYRWIGRKFDKDEHLYEESKNDK